MSANSIQTIDMSHTDLPLIAWESVKQKNKEIQKSKSRMIEEHFHDVWMMMEEREVISFHQSIRWTFFIINNIIPLFPVSGILASTPKNLSCNRSSVPYFLNTVLLILGVVEMILTARLVIKLGLGVSSSAAFLFYVVTVTAGLLLRNLARKWPQLMAYWNEKESVFLKSPYSAPKYNPTVVMTSVATLIFTIVLVEHTTYHMTSYQDTLLNLQNCNLSDESNILNHLYRRERGHIADVIPYSVWLLPLLEWQNFAFALSWSYIDVIIVNISIGITTRFKQLNKRVNAMSLNLSEERWLCLRQQYGALTDLVLEVNSHLSSLILLSCGNNLYFIVVNIFRSFTPRETLIETIHFFLVLFVILLRTTITLFATSSINNVSKGIVNHLRKVPQKSWNFEIERFINQIEAQTVALTGKNMFKLTRKVILAFAGTIITFEIALLDQVESEKSNIKDCHATFSV